MRRQKELLAHLLDAFPPKAFSGDPVARHHPEYAGMRAALGGASWWSVPGLFIHEHADHLPLLTREAYKAFLPAWMYEAAKEPTGSVAAYLMSNLGEGRFASDFSQQESYAVVEIAKWIAESNCSGADDAVRTESLTGIMEKWGGSGS